MGFNVRSEPGGSVKQIILGGRIQFRFFPSGAIELHVEKGDEQVFRGRGTEGGEQID
jgi:hypothetical protein